jgi:hypothetical protein
MEVQIMKKFLTVSLVFAMVMVFSNASASDEWNTFSDNLVQALSSDNDGLKASAMQMIIKHEGKVWVHDAAYNVYVIFKEHENPKMRQLALVALYKMQNDWFLNSIKDDFEEETNPAIRHQLLAIMCCKSNPAIEVEVDERYADNTATASTE